MPLLSPFWRSFWRPDSPCKTPNKWSRAMRHGGPSLHLRPSLPAPPPRCYPTGRCAYLPSVIRYRQSINLLLLLLLLPPSPLLPSPLRRSLSLPRFPRALAPRNDYWTHYPRRKLSRSRASHFLRSSAAHPPPPPRGLSPTRVLPATVGGGGRKVPVTVCVCVCVCVCGGV